MNKACFFDRDGVVNQEVDYLFEPDKTVLEQNIVPALAAVKAHGYLAIIVTNQAGVARGLYEESAIMAVYDKIQALLRPHGLAFDALYYCPHHPDFTGVCACRKPAPGLLLRAAAEHDIDLSASLMIGDRLSDTAAGLAAGCRAAYLVKTGYGATVAAQSPIPAGVLVVADALAAFENFLEHFTVAPGQSEEV